MSIIHNDTDFGNIPARMPPSTVRTRAGIVIGRAYIPSPRWDNRPDAEHLQRALLARPRTDGGWRSVSLAVALGAAIAFVLFLGLSGGFRP